MFGADCIGRLACRDHYWGGCGGLSECPGGFPEAWPRFTNLVRTVSPDTIIGTGPDVDHSAGGESGTGSYPRWNTCNSSDPSGEAPCSAFGPIGSTFRPREADATIQNPGDAWCVALDTIVVVAVSLVDGDSRVMMGSQVLACGSRVLERFGDLGSFLPHLGPRRCLHSQYAT